MYFLKINKEKYLTVLVKVILRAMYFLSDNIEIEKKTNHYLKVKEK